MANFELTLYGYWTADEYHECLEEFHSLDTEAEEEESDKTQDDE